MNITEQQSNSLIKPKLKFTDIMPYGKIGQKIDRNKVFEDKTRTYFPKQINRNKCLNEKGEFDSDLFTISRLRCLDRRKNYLNGIKNKLNHLKILLEKNKLESFYLILDLEEIIRRFKEAYFLGENEEIYSQDFFIDLQDILVQLELNKSLSSDTDNSVNDLCKIIEEKTSKGLFREEKRWEDYLKKLKEQTELNKKKYIKEGNNLDVDKILEALNGRGDWGHEAMLLGFYTAKCDEKELSKLQNGVLASLENKLRNLNPHHFFTILERVLPYIHDGYSIKFELPEIFCPEYLSHISVYDLTLEDFESQIRTKGKKLNWSNEIQDKLIDQFKKYGQSENGKIGFGQGSEKLRYRQQVTGCINEKNIDNYIGKEDMGLDKRPIPSILDHNRINKSEEISQLLKS